MTEVITIKYRNRGKAYYFDPAGITAAPGDHLVVETAKGMELGICVEGNHPVEDSETVQPLRPVLRKATADDLRVVEYNRSLEKDAFGICRDLIRKRKLEMKLVDVECSFDGNKILFYFTADGRVDFRELVKDLAGVFRTRIELRQIGVRDEARMLGGLGICGRPFCCNQFLSDFHPVSTKMAKTQSMSLNPVKISGTCGRLMCCLRYEQEAYEDLVKHVPKTGAFVQTVDGYGSVTQVSLLRQRVKVRLDGISDNTERVYTADQVAEVPGGRPPEGGVLPQVLHYVPQAREEIEDDPWLMPEMLPSDYPAEGSTKPEPKVGGHRRSRGGSRGDRQEHAERPRSGESGRKASGRQTQGQQGFPGDKQQSAARKNSRQRGRRTRRPGPDNRPTRGE